MFMKLPSARYLKRRGRQAFESETALQRFFEKGPWQRAGLRVVCSSRRGQGGLWKADAIVIDSRNRPAIVEYKRDIIDQSTITQLCGYREALLADRDRLATLVADKWKGTSVSWKRVYLVPVGYRYANDLVWPKLPATRFRPLRYGYDAKHAVTLQRVTPGEPRTYGDEPVRRFSKGRAFGKHLRKTTDAGRQAFKALSNRLRKGGLERRFPGKNRVRFWSDETLQAEVMVTSVGLQMRFRKKGTVADPEGLVAKLKRRGLNRSMDLISPIDVNYALSVLNLSESPAPSRRTKRKVSPSSGRHR